MLLQTKFHMPTARTALVARPHLLAKLQQGQSGKVTLVCAPAGFGKTTLVAGWLQSLANAAAVAWLSLDQAENDPTQLGAYLVAAIHRATGQVGRTIQPALQAPGPDSKTVIIALLNELAAHRRPVLLALDDYHLIDNPAIHELISFVIEQMPAPLHLVIISRTDPALPLARLRVRREINEIRAEDLRFTPNEVATFLQQILGRSLTPSQTAALEARTEGWVAGLQLAALALQHEQNIDRFLASFDGGHRHILDYLTEEALQHQPPEVRHFLLQTSILERMAAPLCNLLTGRSDSQAMLMRLEQANLFLIPLDDHRQWYRYHHLFADLLRKLLAGAIGETGVAQLHIQAARWLAEEGQMADAIHHALAGQDYHLAADLVEAEDLPAENRGTLYTLVSWYKALPEAVLRLRPKLTIRYAHKLMMTAHSDVTEAMLNSPWLAELTDSELQGEILLLRGFVALARGQHEQALTYAQTAQGMLPLTNDFRAGPYGLQGHIYYQQGQLAAAEAAYQRAATLDEEAGRTSGALDFYMGLAKVYEAQQRPTEAEQTIQHCLKLVAGTAWPIEGNLYIRLAWAQTLRADFATAEMHLRKALAIFQQAGEISGVRNTLLEFAFLRLMQRDLSAAESFWCAAQQLPATPEQFWGEIQLEIIAVELAWHRGDPEPMRRWLQTPPTWKTQWASKYKFTCCQYQVLLAVSTANATLPAPFFSNLNELLTETEKSNDLISRLYLLSLLVLAEVARGDRAQALRQLASLFALAAPHGYQLCFLEHGKPMQTLVEEAVTLGIGGDFAHEVLQTLRRLESAMPTALPLGATLPPLATPATSAVLAGQAASRLSSTGVLVEPLTAREQEVLTLIMTGLTNQEIAEQLVLSVATVKRHISNLYNKLGVEHRPQAIARAHELRLL